LRIGVSAAKGIAFAASVPLIGIETTYSMFRGLMGEIKEPGCNTLYCPMLDARRMEVYYAIYDCRGNSVKDISAEVIDTDSFADIPQHNELVFFGDGASKLRDVIRRPNIRFEENFRMSAAHLCSPSYKALREKRFEDVAYFEPLYLKDFITTKQKKNILGT
jgi:tRNA threonylcarbamoyladenosine biosynthesis protein TsaB